MVTQGTVSVGTFRRQETFEHDIFTQIYPILEMTSLCSQLNVRQCKSKSTNIYNILIVPLDILLMINLREILNYLRIHNILYGIRSKEKHVSFLCLYLTGNND